MDGWITFQDRTEGHYQTNLRVDTIESISIGIDVVRVITAEYTYWVLSEQSPDDYRMLVKLALRLTGRMATGKEME